MKTITFYDTETTKYPEWGIPSGDEKQPHLVSLAAIQCSAETEEIIQSFELIIKPDGWETTEDALKVHGITTEFALMVGVPEQFAVEILIELCGDSVRVAHNKTFDQRIIRIALKRLFSKQLQEKWAEKESHKCTMQMARPIMKLKDKNGKSGKAPNLAEAYKFFIGEDLENAHSAMADTVACMEIYFAMKELEKPKNPCSVDICEFRTGAVYPPECINCEHDIPF